MIDKEARPSPGYPDLKQETDYSWQVITCAHPNGEACNNDNPSAVQTFKTFRLAAPSNLGPADGGIIYTYEPRYTISWELVQGAKYYQYEVTFKGADPKDSKEDCEEGKVIAEGITDRSSVDLPLECWGEYEWTVTACLDKNCDDPEIKALRLFILLPKKRRQKHMAGGLSLAAETLMTLPLTGVKPTPAELTIFSF